MGQNLLVEVLLWVVLGTVRGQIEQFHVLPVPVATPGRGALHARVQGQP